MFAAANRQALTWPSSASREVPGVRAVFGPAGLLDIRSTPAARPARGRCWRGAGAETESESEGEAARQRVVRRADAVGWFLTENGRRVRFFVDTDDWPRVAAGVANALAASGLGPGAGVAERRDARPLWPDPRHRGRLLPIALSGVWALFALVALGARAPGRGAAEAGGGGWRWRSRPPWARRRRSCWCRSTGCASLGGWRRWRRGGRVPVLAGAGAAGRAWRAGRRRRAGRLLLIALVVVVAGVALLPSDCASGRGSGARRRCSSSACVPTWTSRWCCARSGG